MFVDEVRIIAQAGDGGDGCISFRREKYEAFGGPNGGDGGKGGDVILEGTNNENHLIKYKYQPQWKAERGQHGMGSDRIGRSGKDEVLLVPLGTIVSNRETGQVVAEILEIGQRVRLLKGGSGGWGNAKFKSSVNRAPRRANPGEPGETGEFQLVLKTIADVGLVGYPNAGKSTLTNMITNARPKMAAYPFTTLHPGVGVIEYPDKYQRLLMADIPGIIEGASENRGLGHRFLRHIERCFVLTFIIDMSGIDGRDPWDDYEQLVAELGAYDKSLLDKPRIVLANKMDEEVAAENLKQFRQRHDILIQPISCLSEEGIAEFKEVLWEKVSDAKARMKEAEIRDSNSANDDSDSH
ncbi:GTPase ObgE [Pelagicoccus sp. SDUM812003]|uniref:GTPase ObgE n=1 Tax=Pelagicoccus sp. SDUM812003 TaxID=3041267 RepID=UPI00280FF959|nr:GTPase ObgE [Pelagicoccus sp. SDUM812003]MDQ8202114.1 GTPase ObgE [Pelagicoccus sp. SDUM812003]